MSDVTSGEFGCELRMGWSSLAQGDPCPVSALPAQLQWKAQGVWSPNPSATAQLLLWHRGWQLLFHPSLSWAQTGRNNET